MRSFPGRSAAMLGLVATTACGGVGDPQDKEPIPQIETTQQRVRAPLPAAHCTVNVQGTGTIQLEADYLPRVIQCENGGADLEALKAQAIAARSVAYYQIATSGSICDSQGCQVYSCGRTPQDIHRRAVAETSGLYLSYDETLTYGFYVDGDHGTSPPSCRGSRSSGNAGASRERWITYNEGKTGAQVQMTRLGYRPPGGGIFGQNRGCMSQWGARCLEERGDDYLDILRFYYGRDIEVIQAPGSCIAPLPENPIPEDPDPVDPDPVDPDPEDPPTLPASVRGVIWDLSTGASPSSSGVRRIDTATVTIDGTDHSVRAGDAFWKLDIAAGTHTLTASAPGYVSMSRELDLTAGESIWASMGLLPSELPFTVVVTGAGGQPLEGAIVHAPGIGTSLAGADGTASFTAAPGMVEVTAFASGHAASTRTIDIAANPGQSHVFSLDVTSPATNTGRVQGVVWDSSRASSAGTSAGVRVDSALVLCSCGIATTARPGDAYFRIDAPPGTHTFTVTAPGFTPVTFDRSVTTGAGIWASTGLAPSP